MQQKKTISMTDEDTENTNLRVSIIGHLPEEAPSHAHTQISDVIRAVAKDTNVELDAFHATMDEEQYGKVTFDISAMQLTPENDD